MSLPAYLFLYDEHGMLVQGECMMPGRRRCYRNHEQQLRHKTSRR